MQNRQRSKGFTIVELLIVIVVIAILAAISIVAFTGINDRARTTQMASGMEQYVRALGNYAVINGAYPTSAVSGALACFDGTVNCLGGAVQSESTALNNAIKAQMSQPITLPEVHLINYAGVVETSTGQTVTGYYFYFGVPVSQSCPTIGGTRFLNTTTSSSVRICRVGLPPIS